jgi:F-type H+-transporting ATPase subunit gamma
MATQQDIARRIRSVRNTGKITKAMELVAASRLRRAQARIEALRPYADRMQQLTVEVAAASAPAYAQPLLERRDLRGVAVLSLTADRGLAGAFNANVIRLAQKFIKDHADAEVQLELVGRKGRDFFRKRHGHITGDYSTLFQKAVRYEDALDIARKVTERFEKAEIDAVYLAVNNFKTVMSSQLVVTRILPVELPKNQEQIDYIYEQPPQELLESLLPRYIEAQIYRAMLESSAAEHAARMTAMESATSNASDVISALTLTMNRVRQASITKEIIEIVSGAAALE